MTFHGPAGPVGFLGPAGLVGRLVAAVLLVGCGPTHADCDEQVCIGDACLATARSYDTEIDPLHFVAADFDGDASVDVIAIGIGSAGEVVAEIHRNEGDGLLGDPEPIDAVGCSAYPVAGDLDGDAAADLVYPACDGNALVVWGGATASTSAIALPFPLGTSAIDDVDGDGRSDLVALGGAGLVLVRGEPGRTLVATDAIALATAMPPSGVRTGDVDGDGVLDAVTWTLGQAGSVALSLGHGDGSFAPAEPRVADTAPASLALGSLDDRAGVELVALAPDQHRLVIDHGDAASSTTDVGHYRPALAAIASGAHAAPGLNDGGDAGPHALVVDGVDPEVRYYALGADGALAEDARLPTPHAAQSVLVPDLDGDGVADVLVGHFTAASFSTWLSSESR